jgi:V/A-type H+-transporting ATPase subunit E
MSETNDIGGLEAALAERASKLAGEHVAGGQQARERILAETRQRLQIEKEREVLVAKVRAERAYEQQIQAAELDLRAELDRLSALAADKARYLPLLLRYLGEAAQAIERDELVAQFNARDLQHLQKDWEKYAREAAPGKQLKLSPDALDCSGGVLVESADRTIRFDNTFEGRMERMEETLHGALAERLMPTAQADKT